jgi:hypothetical protein
MKNDKQEKRGGWGAAGWQPCLRGYARVLNDAVAVQKTDIKCGF